MSKKMVNSKLQNIFITDLKNSLKNQLYKW